MSLKINPIRRPFKMMLQSFKKSSKVQNPATKNIIRDSQGVPQKVILNGNQVYTYNGKEVIEETDGVLKHHHFSLWEQLTK
ncbi:MAG: hypothetical protein MJ231_01560 [bacterium]|nr:hypothetical protein [bacterium]